MSPDDPNIRWIEEPKLGLAGRMYLPLVVQGLTTTVKHLFSPKLTVNFPGGAARSSAIRSFTAACTG